MRASRFSFSAKCFSTYCEANPLLSPLTRRLVLFIDVGWTANQLRSPSGFSAEDAEVEEEEEEEEEEEDTNLS